MNPFKLNTFTVPGISPWFPGGGLDPRNSATTYDVHVIANAAYTAHMDRRFRSGLRVLFSTNPERATALVHNIKTLGE